MSDRLRDDTTGGVIDVEWLDSVSRRLRTGRIVDSEFDDIYPTQIRSASPSFWTPISVAIRAAKLLAASPASRVLDVGSGAGKLCIVGAASTGASFTGIEHRKSLVEFARNAASLLGVRRARFLHGTFDVAKIERFDAVYLFNPFEENLWESETRFDETVELSKDRFASDIERIEAFLARARLGTRVVTYHGFGGEMPVGYRHALRERVHTDYLDLWIKTNDRPHSSVAKNPPL